MTGEESGDVRKSETPQGGVGSQMPREGSIPSAGLKQIVDTLIVSDSVSLTAYRITTQL